MVPRAAIPFRTRGIRSQAASISAAVCDARSIKHKLGEGTEGTNWLLLADGAQTGYDKIVTAN